MEVTAFSRRVAASFNKKLERDIGFAAAPQLGR